MLSRKAGAMTAPGLDVPLKLTNKLLVVGPSISKSVNQLHNQTPHSNEVADAEAK